MSDDAVPVFLYWWTFSSDDGGASIDLLTGLADIIGTDKTQPKHLQSVVQRWIKSEDHDFHVQFAQMVSTALCDEAFSTSAGYVLVPALTKFHSSLFGTVFNDCFTLNDPINRKQVDT